MVTRTTNVLVLFAILLGVAAGASAQTQTATAPTPAPATTANMPTFELSAGYQFLHVPDQSFPFGINVDGVRHFGSLGLVGEVGWARHDEGDEAAVDSNTGMWTFGAGPRWTGFGAGRTWPYAQVLVGAEVAHTSIELSGNDESSTDTAFMLQPGIGATFITGDGWGVFGQVDYRRTFFDEPDDVENSVNNQFRVYFGVRMILD